MSARGGRLRETNKNAVQAVRAARASPTAQTAHRDNRKMNQETNLAAELNKGTNQRKMNKGTNQPAAELNKETNVRPRHDVRRGTRRPTIGR